MTSRTILARKMQEYMDDAPALDTVMEGFQHLTTSDATKLFNDFLMFLGDGRDPPIPVLDPNRNGEGA